MTGLRFFPAMALAIASGLLYWLSFAGLDIWPLAFFAYVPFWIAIHGQRPRRALLLGTAAGLAMSLTGFYWLQNMLKTFSGFPSAVCFLFVIIISTYQGGRVGVTAWLYARATSRGWPAAPVLVLAFTATELLYPLLFTWYFAGTVHDVPVLTQTADLGGPILVGLVLLAGNIGIAELLFAVLAKRAAAGGKTVALGPYRDAPQDGSGSVRAHGRRALVSFAVLGVAVVYGLIRVPMTDARVAAAEKATVGVVQGNMGLMQKREDPGEGLRRHRRMTDELREKGADFVVWSESSVTFPVPEHLGNEMMEERVGRHLRIPAIFGAVYYRIDPDRERWYNTALSTDAKGHVNGRYDKTYLLAFGEYLPFGETFPILYEWSPHSGRFSAGKRLDPLTLEIEGKKRVVAPLICYEDILPGFTNTVVRATDPELIVNITNDAWFGDTTEPWEHLALSQLRAIEHRRFLIRSTNSGVSAIMDPVGRVVSHTGTFKAETLLGKIAWLRGRTVYEIVGDVPWYLTSLAAFILAFVRRRRNNTTKGESFDKRTAKSDVGAPLAVTPLDGD